MRHRWSQIQDLDGRLGDQVADLVRERLFTSSVENRRQAGPLTQPDIARRGTTRHHPIPERLTLQSRLVRAEGRLESPFRAGHEVHARELEPSSRLRLTCTTRQRRQVLVERVAHELAVWRDV